MAKEDVVVVRAPAQAAIGLGDAGPSLEEIRELLNEARQACQMARPPVGKGRAAWEQFLAEMGFFSECSELDRAVLPGMKDDDKHEQDRRRKRILRLKRLLQKKADVLVEDGRDRGRDDVEAELRNLEDEDLGDSWISEDGKWVYWRIRWVQFCRSVLELPDPIFGRRTFFAVEEFCANRLMDVVDEWKDSRAALRKWNGQALPPESRKSEEAGSDGTKQSAPGGGREDTSPPAPVEEKAPAPGAPATEKVPAQEKANSAKRSKGPGRPKGTGKSLRWTRAISALAKRKWHSTDKTVHEIGDLLTAEARKKNPKTFPFSGSAVQSKIKREHWTRGKNGTK